MADNDVIKEFLVSLGFDLNATSQKRFVDGISLADKAVLGITASLAGFTAALLATANGMERLFFVSQRTQASVQGIRSLQYAVTNLGGSADDALSSIEGIAKFMRTNPGGEGFLGALGVRTRSSNGQLRDTVDILSDLGKQFASMPYYQAARRASLLGIDEKTLQALIRGVGEFSDEYRKMTHDLGFDSDQAAKTSHGFMVQLRGLRGELGLVSDAFFTTFAEKLTPVIERARKWIETNAGLIRDWINRIVDVLGVLAKIVSTVIERAIEIFDKLYLQFQKLDPQTKALAETVLALYAAFRLLNIVFAASPIGRLIALGSALLLLYDDYKVWQEGGKSLINWDNWKTEIDLATQGIETLVGWIDELLHSVGRLADSPTFMRIFTGAQNIGRNIAALAGNARAQDEIDRMDWAGFSDADKATWRQRWAGYSPAEKAKLAKDHPTLANLIAGTDTGAPAGSAPLGIRSNNPGNLRTGANGGFGRYATPAEGLAALGRQLNLYATGQSKAAGGRTLNTVQDIISTYAPSNENDTASYIADVSKRLGVSPTARLNLQDRDTLAALMRGIVNHENGQNPYSNDQYRQAAASALSGGTANIDQTNNYYIDGAKDPRAVGKEVQNGQNATNQRLVRNLSTAVQ